MIPRSTTLSFYFKEKNFFIVASRKRGLLCILFSKLKKLRLKFELELEGRNSNRPTAMCSYNLNQITLQRRFLQWLLTKYSIEINKVCAYFGAKVVDHKPLDALLTINILETIHFAFHCASFVGLASETKP